MLKDENQEIIREKNINEKGENDAQQTDIEQAVTLPKHENESSSVLKRRMTNSSKTLEKQIESIQSTIEVERTLANENSIEKVIEDIEEAGEVIAPPPSSPSSLTFPKPTANIYNQSLLISSFAILGCYLRIVLTDATPSGFVNYLTSQFIGSFVIGIIFVLKTEIQPDLFIGISTGFCGSLTTFSSWQVDIVEILVNVPGSPSSVGGKAYAWFQDQLIGFAVPFAGLTFGKHFAKLTMFYLSTKRLQQIFLYQLGVASIKGLSVIVFLLAWIGVILGAAFVPSITTFSLIFAPFGAWLRFVLSKYLNPISLEFFYGTFVANVLGSVISGSIFDVMVSLRNLPKLQCASLWAVVYGFCGSLSTISTFVNEIHTLPRVEHAYIYGFVSVLVSQALLIIIMGSFIWSQNPATVFDSSSCYVLQ
jgi:CrcB protein